MRDGCRFPQGHGIGGGLAGRGFRLIRGGRLGWHGLNDKLPIALTAGGRTAGVGVIHFEGSPAVRTPGFHLFRSRSKGKYAH